MDQINLTAFSETHSDAVPVIRREQNTVYYPAFVRIETKGDRTVYRYYEVPIPYSGQELDDYEAFSLQNYAAIRRYFYGSPEVQSEMRDDNTWEAHRQGIRSAFPKRADEVNQAVARFEAIKAAFWGTVDAAVGSVGKTRADIIADYPEGFTGEEMLEWATLNGIPAETQALYGQNFILVNLNLLSNNRNWNELFKEV